MRILIIICYTLLAILLYQMPSYALLYNLPKIGNKLVGKNIKITIPENNTLPLEHYAKKYQIGLSNLLEINPSIDVYLPIPKTQIIIPYQLILPNTSHEGIIINSAEMRLFFYPKHNNTVIIFPIGIGEIKHPTPYNWTTLVYKKKYNPTWIPTKKIQEEYIARGDPLPKIIPPGPNNPMGLHALYIGKLYAIHGTNSDFGIGLRVSHGCIRLRNNDMKYLFENVPIGTKVKFINEPVKITQEKNGKYYLEVHNPLSFTKQEFYTNEPKKITLPNSINNILQNKKIDQCLVQKALKQRLGIPVDITFLSTNNK